MHGYWWNMKKESTLEALNINFPHANLWGLRVLACEKVFRSSNLTFQTKTHHEWIVEFPMIFFAVEFPVGETVGMFFFLEVPVGRPSVTTQVVVGYLVILMVLVEIPWVTSWKVKIVTDSGFPELNLPRWCFRNLVHQLKGSWHLMILLILRLIHPLQVFFCC